MNAMTSIGGGGNANEDHEELLAEMELIERLPTQERLKQAKRRRALQLKKWADYERECQMQEYQQQPFRQIQNQQSTQQTIYNASNQRGSSNQKTSSKSNFRKPGKISRSIRFQDHIVLLDAIMRKDFDEVQRLLESGVTPNSANEDGLTAIHQVSSGSCCENTHSATVCVSAP